MEFLNRIQVALNPTATEYIQAVDRLKRAWGAALCQGGG